MRLQQLIARGILGLLALALPSSSAWAAEASAEAHAVDQREACLSCHDFEDAFGASVQHQPFAAAECSACHNPHASRISALLRARPALLCARCHGEIAETMQREHVHQPVSEGRCSSCHDPHASKHEGLLVEDGVELCTSCHEQIGGWQERDNQHSPFRKGQCLRCHDPHAGDHPALGVSTEADTCGACHPSSAKFRSDHGGFPVEEARCHQCHDPHASTRSGLFRSYLHAPFDGGDCTTCHAGADSAVPFELVSSQAELCGDCHADQVDAARSAAFPHVSAGGGECTTCHNPHMGEEASLLNGREMTVCLSCHDPGGARSGDEGRFSTHSDLPCSTCHAPHGSEGPLLLANEVIQLCNECHAHDHNVSHPMGVGLLDPRNNRPLDCLSCHGMHEAPAEGYLHADGQGEVCVGCHKEINF